MPLLPERTSTERAIFRYEVPCDDQWHGFDLTGEVLHVATRRLDVVEFWASHTAAQPASHRYFRVFGTGHPIDGAYLYRGTAIVVGGALVWHLMERPLFSGEVAG